MAAFPEPLLSLAREVLEAARVNEMRIVTAESCTGGLIAGCLTAIPGSSDVLERGFVTYSNESKIELLGVPTELIDAHGAVSEQVAKAMAFGALNHSQAQISVACTGIAGPGGGSADKPIGLVFIAARYTGASTRVRRCEFGDIGRDQVREKSVQAALELLHGLL